MNNADVNQILEDYESLLRAETALFSTFSGILELLRGEVKDRNWQNMEKTVESLNNTGEHITKIENARHTAFCGLKEMYGLSPDAPVKMLSPYICNESRKRINALSVKLKLEVIKVQTQAKSIDCYTRSVSGFLKRFFEELFPHTKGNMYSNKGTTKKNSESPYVVNKQL
ncbi:MAG: hypothetical protein JXJ04_17145 [Spirochaetales bacterium]|nr:hypothetical protein [Spirochaetales bacterium]